jgi:hypothetical protein
VGAYEGVLGPNALGTALATSMWTMKLMVNTYLPPVLRPDEEALIEAIIAWAATERRIHGHLPDLPVRIATVGGEVLVKCAERIAFEEEDDDATVRFRNIELT